MEGNTKHLVFCVCITFTMLSLFVGVASAATIYVPDDHARIQWAVDNATAGDTIIVRDGTYYENVGVWGKQLTIKSENGSAYTTIDGNENGNVIKIYSSNVKIEGFTITNSSRSYYPYYYFLFPYAGLQIQGSGNTIANNNITNNKAGIFSYRPGGENNTIISNNISSNTYGMWFWTYNNTVIFNNITNNSVGIYVHSSGNIVTFNNINDNRDGIWLYYGRNTISSNIILNNRDIGIQLSGYNNAITKNTISNSRIGIGIYGRYNTIEKNTISNNDDGIYLLYNPSGGVYSSNNTIYINNFIDNNDTVNSTNAWNSTNIWNSTSPMTYSYSGSEFENYLGNYWDDYTGSDADKDGIGDTPYSIDSDKDNYPLMERFENYFASADEHPLIAIGKLYYNSQRKLARTSDGVLHCVYQRSNGSYFQIWHAYSADGGKTWSEEQITNASRNHDTPSIAVDSKDHIHVVWAWCEEPRGFGKKCTIQYRVKTKTWQPIEDVITSYGCQPSIAVDSQDNIHLVVGGYNPGGYSTDYIKYLKRNSSGWGSPEKVSTQVWANCPAIAIDQNNNVHVVFRYAPYYKPVVGLKYCKRTADGWQSEETIHPPDQRRSVHSLALDSSANVYVVWASSDTQSIEIAKRISSGWQKTEKVWNESGYAQIDPTIATDSNDYLHVVWAGKHPGSPNYWQLRYRNYTTSWSPVQNLTYTSENQTSPNLIWAWWPVVDTLRTNIPKEGFAFIWNDNETIRFYKSTDLAWKTPLIPPTCKLELQKDGVKIDRIEVGEFFDIVITDYSGDIEKVRFLSDESQNGKVDEGFTWTDWYDWNVSKEDWTGHWYASNKTKTWAFATLGEKEVWAEVNDSNGRTAYSSTGIYAGQLYNPNLLIPIYAPFMQTAHEGTKLTYIINVTNGGYKTDTIDLSTSDKYGWDIHLSETSVTLAPGESTDVYLNLTIEENKTNTITINGTSRGDTSKISQCTVYLSCILEGSGLFAASLQFSNKDREKHTLSFDVPDYVKISDKLITLNPSEKKEVNLIFDPKPSESGLNSFYIDITDVTTGKSVRIPLKFKECEIIATNFDMAKDSYNFSNGIYDFDTCYGMSETSILYFKHAIPLPSGKLDTYSLTEDEAEKNITHHQRSLTNHILAWRLKVIPGTINVDKEYNKLEKNIGNGNPMILCVKDHAVVAYKIVKEGDKSYIFIYENEEPYKISPDNFYLSFPYATYNLTSHEFYYIGDTKFLIQEAEKEVLTIEQALMTSPISTLMIDCPVNVTITDQYNRIISDNGTNEIPNATIVSTDEPKLFYLPADLIYNIDINAYDVGNFTLAKESPLTNKTASLNVFANISTTNRTQVTLEIGPTETSPLKIDSDGDGTVDEEKNPDMNVTLDVNQPPIARFTFTPESPVVNQTITFNASSSFDPDGTIVSYEWDFGDGNITNTTEAIITYSHPEAGDYTVNLRVTDNDGATNSISKTITILPLEKPIFDTGLPANPYPSIFGIHKGTIKPNVDIRISKLYTYSCVGTGGHTEYARIWNATWNATAAWKGYVNDWHNITFDKTVVLLANETYNYTIRTGSYPQIHHNKTLTLPDGKITCTKFTDANGRVYYDWIPAIRLH